MNKYDVKRFERNVPEVPLPVHPICNFLVNGFLKNISAVTDTEFLDTDLLPAVTDRIESEKAEEGVSFALQP
jgi:hypothetical protein